MGKDINESVEKILLYKGTLIKNKKDYREYIKDILKEHSINDAVEAFVMGAVDGMVYDIACSLDFTKRKGRKFDWTSYEMRKRILNKLFKKR